MSSTEAFSVEQQLDEASTNRDAGRLDEAVQLYRSILQENPQNAEAQKALHGLQKLMKKATNTGNRRQNSKAKTRKKVRLVKAGFASRQGSAQAQEGLQPHNYDVQRLFTLYKSGQLMEAEAGARKHIQEFPHAVDVVNLLGTVLGNLGKNEEAIACYVQAITLKPDYAEAHNNLGIILRKLGLREQAEESHRLALAAHPEFVQAYNNLGIVLRELGRPEEATASHVQALRINPDSVEALSGFATALQEVDCIDADADLKALIIRCFESDAIASVSVRPVSEAILKTVLQKIDDIDALTPNDLADLDPSTNGLLSANLRYTFIADTDLEIFLSSVRRKLLTLRSEAGLNTLAKATVSRLLEAFAYQGFLNEYVWQVTEQENSNLESLEADIARDIQEGVTPGEFDLYLLTAYKPLYAIECIRVWALKHDCDTESRFEDFLEHVILNPAREQEISQQIEQLTSIDNDVSVAVRSQYEENPYPRWSSLTISKPAPYTDQILNVISPYRPSLEPTSATPEVLIAGCGTGKHPISCALTYQHSNVLAVDLSKTSLAFAKRRAEELKVPNIRFAQADILKLGELDNRFDIIECGGVLHHMADPEAGLKVLLGLLKPGGCMKIGLYSELARQHIVKLREFASKEKFKSTLQDMRDFRAWLRASDIREARMIQTSGDFYSASALRDLLFHVQEHRFTVPQIADLLDRHMLDFLGFYLAKPSFKTAYLKRFPDDPDCIDLNNWHQFEQENPRMFSGLYQFWCQKSV